MDNNYTKKLNNLLSFTFDEQASDLHLSVGHPPTLRLDGRLVPLVKQKKKMIPILHTCGRGWPHIELKSHGVNKMSRGPKALIPEGSGAAFGIICVIFYRVQDSTNNNRNQLLTGHKRPAPLIKGRSRG